MRKKYRYLLAVCLVILNCCFCLADVTPEQLEPFREFVKAQMVRDRVPGLTAGYIRWNGEGENVWVEGFGYSDLENKVAARAESAYRLASVSKTMTAAAVLKLVEQGKIDLDAEIQKYVPYFPKKKSPTSIRQLLGHLGGISHYQNYDAEGRIKEHKTTREAIAIFENFDLATEPGNYLYSSYGYNLLGAAVEGASGISFDEYMQKNIWEPLEMNDTCLDDPTAIIPNRARGYRILDGEVKNSEFIDISSRFAGGGTRSTIPDVLKFAKGLSTGKIVSSKTVETMFTSMIDNDQHLTDYGMGWGILVANGRYAVSHSGSQQETRTVLYVFPADRFAIAVALNLEDANPATYARRLYEILQGEKWNFTAYTPKTQEAYNTINAVFQSGLAFYKQYGRPVTEDRAALAEAFSYVNSCLESGSKVQKKIEEGRHPASGRPFQKVGSYMSAQLQKAHGDGRIESYHGSGPIVFVNDFIKVSQNADLHLVESFTQTASQWNESWKKLDLEKFRNLAINQDSDLALIQQDFQKHFASNAAYPDFSRDLASLAIRVALKGDKNTAIKASEIDITFYPETEIANAVWGTVQAAFGDESKAIPVLRKAVALNEEGSAGADSLSDIAYGLARNGDFDSAIKLMNTTITLHPKNSQLYCDLGEAYLEQKDRNNAVTTFKKGLAIDPNSKCAKELLAKASK